MKYVEFIEGGYKNRGNVIPAHQLKVTNPYSCFRSMFIYDENLLEYVNENKKENKDGKLVGSVEDYDGLHSADTLLFDFDGRVEDFDRVRKEATNFVEQLIYVYEVPQEYIRIAFSGGKGFHIALPFQVVDDNPVPSKDFWLKYQTFVKQLIKDFTYADDSIYNPMRVFRILNTKHEKTRLYKIPLTLTQMKDANVNIKKLATKPRKPQYEKIDFNDIAPLEELNKIWQETIVEEDNKTEQQKQSAKSNSFINAISTPVSTGNRHDALARIGGYLVDKGVDYNNALAICRVWDSNNVVPMGDDRLQHDLKGLYKSFWDKRPEDVQMSEPTFEEILVYGDRYTEAYHNHIERIQKFGRIGTGYPLIDETIRGIIAGEVFTIVGKTSVGKSALLENILIYNALLGRLVLFFSLEMPIATVAERALQMLLKISGRDIERRYFDGDAFIVEEAVETFEKLQNLVTIYSGGLDYSKVSEYIFRTEDTLKRKVDLVGIDYAGLLRGAGDSLYSQQSNIARDVKGMSGRTQTGIISLAQVSKNYKETDPIDLDATRDSGVITEATDYMLGMWRGDGDDPDNIILKGNIIKNRNGSRLFFHALMNRISLQFQVDEYRSNLDTSLPIREVDPELKF